MRDRALTTFLPIKAVLLAIFLIGHFTTDVEACSCSRPGSSIETFCKEKWVSRLQILSKPMINVKRNRLEYMVRPIEVFKMPPSFKTFPNHVYTAPHSCGVTNLEPKTEYLLAGSLITGKEPYIYACTMFVDGGKFSVSPLQWQNVSASLQQILRTHNSSACEKYDTEVVTRRKGYSAWWWWRGWWFWGRRHGFSWHKAMRCSRKD